MISCNKFMYGNCVIGDMMFKYGKIEVLLVIKIQLFKKVVFIDINFFLSGNNFVLGEMLLLFLMDLKQVIVCVKIVYLELKILKVLFVGRI